MKLVLKEIKNVNSLLYKISSKRGFCSAIDALQYQYMQQSNIPTSHFQKTLPHLPIPKLKLTCSRFLFAVEPLLDKEEFQRTRKTVIDFENGDGKVLQALLEASDSVNRHTSYISQPWFDMYLSERNALPLNSNPLLIMKNDVRNDYQSQLLRATNLIISSMRFWRSLQADLLEPEIFHLNPKKTNTQTFRRRMEIVPEFFATYAAYALKTFPLDMSQYNRLFGVSRIPKKGKDFLVQQKSSKHILVMRGGNLYSVDVLDDNGNIEQSTTIFQRLTTVLQMAENSGDSRVPLGSLTSMNRDEWAAIRRHLIDDLGGVNKYLLEKEIDAALLCLCFDKPDDPLYNEDNPEPFFKHLLAGNSKNRWFDKSVSLIISADGISALNFEHSWGDGVAVLRYFNEVYNDTVQSPYASPNMCSANSVDMKCVRPIQFKTDEMVENAVKKAILNSTHTVSQLNVDIIRHPFVNKELCKKHGLSPDAIMQLSFQLAYKCAFNDYVGTYESCSTAAFRHGRTETIRPCTMATKQLCENYMLTNRNQTSPSELFASIKKCSYIHSKLTKEAAMGQGFDRHLFALKHQAIIHNKRIPQIYYTEAYKKINHNIISTSTLSSNALFAGSFGPVVPNGLGIAYSIQADYCGAVVTSYKTRRNGEEFTDNLRRALDYIYNILNFSSN